MTTNARSLMPMPSPLALLYIGIPALIFILSVYCLISFFMNQGYSEFISDNLRLMPILGAILRGYGP